MLPIQFPVKEARAIARPYPLKGILKTLRKNGYISHFVIGDVVVLVWPMPGRRLDVALFSEGLGAVTAPAKLKLQDRRPSAAKTPKARRKAA